MDLRDLYRAHLEAVERDVRAVLAKTRFDALIVHSGSLTKRSPSDDQFWPMRATPHFQHWIALSEPDAMIVIDASGRKLVRLREINFWETPASFEAPSLLEAWDAVEETQTADLARHVPAASSSRRVAFVGDDPSRGVALGLSTEAINPPALVALLDKLRVSKSDYEVACLREANLRAANGHKALATAFADNESLSELDLHLLYLSATRQDDADTPYKNIVAAGVNAATLHHVTYSRTRKGEESLLVDAGACSLGYASDISRTHVRGAGEAASRFRALADGVDAMQRALVAEARVGLPYERLHDRAHERLAELLRSVGILRVGVDEAVATRLTRAFLPHGLGHSLGLQTHDVGCADVKPRADNPFLRNTTSIATRQVFTIEPGVYFIDALLAPLREGEGADAIDWKVVDQLAPFGGVRVEDDVFVDDVGAMVNLTREVLA